MTSSQPRLRSLRSPAPDLAAIWSSARRLHPIYAEMAREFVIDLPGCADLEAHVDTPGRESVEQAQQWLNEMDDKIQVHQLRQFLQTSSLVDADGLIALLQHFLAKTHAQAIPSRDKIDFLLVQYFSQSAPTELDDSNADIAYVAQALEPVLGKVELKTPVWLNALDRVLDSARRCRSLDELLHGGVLEQGRKAKAQAGDLFYLPVALVAFTRFGYLMRRAFFRLMLADLNNILDGLTELEEKGVETIDCRRAQFSAQGTDYSAAHDLPVLESHVPGGVFLRPAVAHAGGPACLGGRRPGPRFSSQRWRIGSATRREPLQLLLVPEPEPQSRLYHRPAKAAAPKPPAAVASKPPAPIARRAESSGATEDCATADCEAESQVRRGQCRCS